MERLFFGFGRDRVVSIGNGGSAEGEAKVHGRACLFFWERESCAEIQSRAQHTHHTKASQPPYFLFVAGSWDGMEHWGGTDQSITDTGTPAASYTYTTCLTTTTTPTIFLCQYTHDMSGIDHSDILFLGLPVRLHCRKTAEPRHGGNQRDTSDAHTRDTTGTRSAYGGACRGHYFVQRVESPLCP